MCSAWQKQERYAELSPADIERIFSDKILSRSVRVVNITGGEPTLRDDLVQIIKTLARCCKNLERIDISTNGINTVQAVDKIEQILAFCAGTEIKVSSCVSVDGAGDIHDSIRNVPGAFERIDKTIDEFKELLWLYPDFSAGMNATISSHNYNNLEEILSYSREKMLGMNFTLAALSEIGVESIPRKDDFLLKNQQKETVIGFIKKLQETRSINNNYGDFMIHWLKTGRRISRCAFREGHSLLCEPDGSVYSCGNFRGFRMGNLLRDPFSSLIRRRGKFDALYENRCGHCNSNCYIDSA